MARIVAVLVLASAVLVSGCLTASPPPAGGNTTAPGGGSGSGGPGGNNTGGNGTSGATVDLAVSSTGQYPVNPGFAPATLSAAAGSIVHVTFTNADTLPLPIAHNWVLEGVTGAETDVVDNGASAEATFPAPPAGEYAYYCSVGDHRDRGMAGTLTVA